MVRLTVLFQKFTSVNKLMVGLALSMVAFLGYQFLTYRQWQRQYWAAVVNDQAGYPARLLWGSLLPPNGEEVKLDDPGHDENSSSDNGMLIKSNWNYDNAELPAHFQLPPRRLRLAWVSVRERTFYQGEFDLPAARIDSLFAQVRAQPSTAGEFRRLTQPFTYGNSRDLPAPVPGLTVVVQPEAGGWVRAWLAGHDRQHTSRLGRFRAKPYRPKWPGEAPSTYAKTPAEYLNWLAKDEQTTRHLITPMP